jgi:hypothetical protein
MQILTVIDDPEAPTVYRYPIDMPGGSTLVKQDDAVVVVSRDGRTVGTFAAPWAVDAEGRSVHTEYRVDGDVLIQVISHRGVAAYPVVADPAYGYTIWFSRADVERMYRVLTGVTTACSFPGVYWLVVIGCRPPATLANAVYSAHYQKKRIKAIYSTCGYSYCGTYTYYVVK